MERGTSTLVAGVAAAVALPVSALLLGLPLWLSAAIAAGVFIGLRLALRPRGLGLRLDDMAEARSETVRSLTAEATAALGRLNGAAREIEDPPMKATVGALATTAGAILTQVKDQPERAMAVRRLLTFYLPNAAAIAEGWQTLESNANPSSERMVQTREVMGALLQAFAQFEN
jgi:hypothetical protein